jgi:hypothetical protein
VSEGATLFLAVNAVRKRAKNLDMTFKEYGKLRRSYYCVPNSEAVGY